MHTQPSASRASPPSGERILANMHDAHAHTHTDMHYGKPLPRSGQKYKKRPAASAKEPRQRAASLCCWAQPSHVRDVGIWASRPHLSPARWRALATQVAPPSPSNPSGFPPPLRNDFSEGFKFTNTEVPPPIPTKPLRFDRCWARSTIRIGRSAAIKVDLDKAL